MFDFLFLFCLLNFQKSFLGKSKRSSVSSDEKPSPERKKMLLTGASPLDIFQTGMDVINASSAAPFKNIFKPLNHVTQDKISSVTSESSAAQISATLKASTKKLFGGLPAATVPSNANSVVIEIPRNVMTPNSVTPAMNINHSLPNHCHALPVKSIATVKTVDMPFPASLMGNKKRMKKQSSRGRGRGQFMNAPEDLKSVHSAARKKSIKKVLPHAAIKKASELQLNDFMHQNAYILNQKRSNPSDIIPSLRSIQTVSSLSSNSQLLNSQALLTSGVKTTMELRDIYKSLQVAAVTQQLQESNSAAYKVVSSVDSSIVESSINSAPVISSAPPNRTISPSNQLPQALRNQLNNNSTSSVLQLTLPGSVATSVKQELKQSSNAENISETHVSDTLSLQKSPVVRTFPAPPVSTVITATANDLKTSPLTDPFQI